MSSGDDLLSYLEGLIESDKEARSQIELLVNGANNLVCFLNHLQSPQKVKRALFKNELGQKKNVSILTLSRAIQPF